MGSGGAFIECPIQACSKIYLGFVLSSHGNTCRHSNDCREGRCVYTHGSLETGVITHYVGSHGAAPVRGGERGRSEHWHRPHCGFCGEEWARIRRLRLESLDVSRLWALGCSLVIWYLALGDLGQQAIGRVGES